MSYKYELNKISLKSNTRENIRKELIEVFLKEKAGKGNGNDASRYQYDVEEYADCKISLKRPAALNKGIDFTVNANFYFGGNGKRKHTNPSHSDIVEILSTTKGNDIREYEKVKDILSKIYNLQSYDLSGIRDITFNDANKHSRPIAIICLIIKWLFIEQDVTYWNWSGRKMLYQGLLQKDLI